MSRTPDFDLAIAAAGTGYIVKVHTGYGAGDLQPQAFELPLDLGVLPRQRRDVGDWVKQARITKLATSEELRQARLFGSALFKCLFDGEVLASFRASRAALPANERLRLRLHLPNQLTTLPWELLFDPLDRQFLALAPDLTLVRYPEVPTPIPPLRVNGALQVVAVLASPEHGEFAPINLDRELRRIEAALKGPRDRGQIAFDVIRGPRTLSQLRSRLRSPIHVLHVLCHGELDQEAGEGVLVFEDADGAADLVNADGRPMTCVTMALLGLRMADLSFSSHQLMYLHVLEVFQSCV